ncbi:pyridoxamine 5'-phosphate oxidase family protein [Mycobacterium sp.]|uniref:pyridoxamine 5'-phosphate oxidase family protein n=1 Tax=Mycobacterium sp. TaxID=1785 RepID=UPI0012006AE5|nr:pyridoxamine 5'-phosphate oxidase family protein [Mycobacterium sp.]TAM73068.1 MAG: pyridoxamine 5'-phosphate oxidase family protein [Mycobacterium sp.]
MRSKKKVDFQALADALVNYPYAYLITVDDEYRSHTVTVEPELRGEALEIGLIGGRTQQNLARRRDVTLLWPPPEPGGYSLIVDGEASVSLENDTGDAVRLEVVPSRALLHRDADSPEVAKGCLHDCVVFSLPG